MSNLNTGPVPSPLPKHLYKIIPSAPPSPLPTEWPLSDLDRNDGFIHLSTADQIPITAGRFFTHTSTLWVLKLPYDRLAANIRWELAGTDGYPHLYEVNFGAADVLDATCFERSEGKAWGEALEGEAWLEQ